MSECSIKLIFKVIRYEFNNSSTKKLPEYGVYVPLLKLLGHIHYWFSIKEVFKLKPIFSPTQNLNWTFKFFPLAFRICSETKPALWLTILWSIIVSTTIPSSSISVIVEMEAKEIKHNEQAGYVEAELSSWRLDLHTCALFPGS